MISFGEYYDAQRDRLRTALENKSTQLNNEWRERYDNERETKKKKEEMEYMKAQDSNVEKVIIQLRERKEKGKEKYGVTTDRIDLSTLEWLQHLQEELMDGAVYIEKIKSEINEKNSERS